MFQRTAQWMFPNPHYHEPVPDGDRWAMRHLPFYGRWFRFLTFYPGSGLDIDRSRIDPDFDDSDGRAINETNPLTRASGSAAGSASTSATTPSSSQRVMPDYPATAKRTLQDNGSWLRCLKKDNVELVRTGIERIVEDGIVTVDGVHHPADVICYATGFLHNDYLWPMTIVGRGGASLREQWGIEPTAYLGITVPELPEPLLPVRAGHEPRARRQPDLPVRVPGELRDGGAAPAAHRRAPDDRAPPGRPRRVPARYEDEISQMVWAHWSVKHSHFKNPDGRIFTLSPWPIPTYWAWTKRFDPDDYELA